jgi:N-acetylmuramoyl-L-alanine amidase
MMRWLRRAAAGVALLPTACVGGDDPTPHIPRLDGPLTVRLTYPTPDTPVPSVDSIALWGTVGTGRATLKADGRDVAVERNGTFAAFIPVAPGAAPRVRLVARRGRDSVVHVIPLRRDGGGGAGGGAGGGSAVASAARGAVPKGAAGSSAGASAHTPPHSASADADVIRDWSRWVRMRRLPSDTADSATQWRPIYSRWRPSGEVAIALPQGMRLHADARTARAIRLRLAPDVRVWIPAVDADTIATPRSETLVATAPHVTADSSEWLVSVGLAERLPTTVELSGDRLVWAIYGARWRERPKAQDGDGRPVRRIVPRDSAAGRVIVDLGLVSIPLGWRTEWRDGALHLRLRRFPPRTNSLSGLVVTLDPGHPPDGTVGPSGLMEDSVTLHVARVAAQQLRALGADVRVTRRDRTPLSLEARAVVAEQSAAHAFVSIHLNAPGPGRPPEAVDGTQVYWMNPNGRALSRALLTEVSRALGQRAIGTYDGEFAVLRPAWPAAALVEGSGIVIPAREAFFRTPAGVDAYARGVVAGIRRWWRSDAARALPGRPAPGRPAP